MPEKILFVMRDVTLTGGCIPQGRELRMADRQRGIVHEPGTMGTGAFRSARSRAAEPAAWPRGGDPQDPRTVKEDFKRRWSQRQRLQSEPMDGNRPDHWVGMGFI